MAKWISGAIKKPGSFTSWCKSQGFPGATPACIAKGKKSKNTTIKRRANLAATLRKLPRHKGPRKKK